MSRSEPLARKKPMSKRPKPKKNAEWYEQWGAAHDHCQCCGIGAELAAVHRWPGLSTHHVAKAGRVHAPTNVVRLCQRCHDCAEGLDTPMWLPGGAKWYAPKLTFAHVLWIKREREPAEYDAARLAKLHMRPLPEPEEPPAVYRAEYLARRNRLLGAAVGALSGSGFPGALADLLRAKMQPR